MLGILRWNLEKCDEKHKKIARINGETWVTHRVEIKMLNLPKRIQTKPMETSA